MPDLKFTVYCFYQSATAPMYQLGISYPGFIGPIGMVVCNAQSDLVNKFGRWGLTPQVQSEILSSVSTVGNMGIRPGVAIPDSEAQLMGISLHDGDMPDESNEVQFWKVDDQPELSVRIFVNDQMVPTARPGVYRWSEVELVLAAALNVYAQVPNQALTIAQLNNIENQIQTTGSATQTWHGIDTILWTGLNGLRNRG